MIDAFRTTEYLVRNLVGSIYKLDKENGKRKKAERPRKTDSDRARCVLPER